MASAMRMRVSAAGQEVACGDGRVREGYGGDLPPDRRGESGWQPGRVLGRFPYEAVSGAGRRCRGATNPDHSAAQRFSYDGVTLTDDDGSHINFGLRKTLCPES